METVAPEGVVGPSIPKQPVHVPIPRIYPRLPPPGDDDGFDYFDTPTKTKPSRAKQKPIDEDLYDWEDSDEELYIKLNPRPPPDFTTPSHKRPYESMDDIEFSPPASPPPAPKRQLADPFTTPQRQIIHTPHTPPDTRAVKSPSSMLAPLSYTLLHQLSPHAATLGTPLWQKLREHLLRCGRVADGAVKGRDAARAAGKKKEIRIEELERRVRILEAEREVDRAVIGALKRNVDVLTGKVKRTD